MISPQLQWKFNILEMMVFQDYQKAGPKEKEKIVEKLARYEADEIIKEINREAEKMYGNKSA